MNQPTNITFKRMQVFYCTADIFLHHNHLPVVLQIGFRGLVKPFLYLGCFGVGNSVIPSISNSAFYQKFQTDSATECSTNFNAFVDSVVLEKFQSSAVYFAAELFRLLRDMALDTIQDQSPSLYPVAEVSKHQLNEIAHPGAVAVIVDLLPAIEANPVFRQKDQSDVGEVADNVGGLQLDEGEKQMYEEVGLFIIVWLINYLLFILFSVGIWVAT